MVNLTPNSSMLPPTSQSMVKEEISKDRVLRDISMGTDAEIDEKFDYDTQKMETYSPAMQVKSLNTRVVTADKVSRFLTTRGHRLPYVEPSTNISGQELLSEEFGQRFYYPGFRNREERVPDAIKRWFDDLAMPFLKEGPLELSEEIIDKSLTSNSIVNPVRDNAIKIMEHISQTISTNVYTAFLHDLYAQRLEKQIRAITIPILFINAFSSALGALSLMALADSYHLEFTVITTILNLFAAILVAIQKFFSLNERAALHGQIKDAYFQVICEQEMILSEFCVDSLNPEGRITNGAGLELTPQDIKVSLEKVADLQKRLEGIELEPIPESIAKLLIPFVKRLQKKKGLQNRNPTLQRFPNILGLKNYYADNPDPSGWCSIHR